MDKPHLFFQYCPKLVVFTQDWSKVLLAKRYGEADYDGTFSFVGGKMETTDDDIFAALRREKSEEIGEAAKVEVYLDASRNLLFRKKDGTAMIVPHYVAQYDSGEIVLNPQEYSEHRWVPLDELAALEPKISNIPEFVAWAVKMKDVLRTGESAVL